MSGPQPDSEKQFLRLTRFGGAGCIAVLFAFIGSIEGVNPRVVFGLNWKVLVGFFGGFAVVWWLLGMLFASAEAQDAGEKTRRKPLFWMFFFCLVTGGVTLGGFGFAMKETPDSKFRDVLFGTVAAVWVIGFCCLMVWRLIQFLEEDSARGEEQFRREQEEKRGGEGS